MESTDVKTENVRCDLLEYENNGASSESCDVTVNITYKSSETPQDDTENTSETNNVKESGHLDDEVQLAVMDKAEKLCVSTEEVKKMSSRKLRSVGPNPRDNFAQGVIRRRCISSRQDDIERMNREESGQTRNILELSTALRRKLEDLPDVLKFIQRLQDYIEKQKKKLKKLKVKLKKKVKSSNVGVQTDVLNHEAKTNATADKSKTFAEEIAEAAEQAMQNTGFVYEETSGMYYDYNTGYYYNAEYGLYYEAKSGTYMTYNPESQIYEFHSQVPVSQDDSNKLKSDQKSKPSNAKRKSDKLGKEQVITSSNMESLMQSFNQLNLDSLRKTALDVSSQWPPCMRIIIEESDLPTLKSGSLHIITFEGGTIGREGKHDILIPDINISKHHLKITFDKEASQYRAIDLGSRNGTILNGKRMSSSKQESDPQEIVHGSRIQLGAITLLCHIHMGNQTCGHCEPGLIQKPEVEKKVVSKYNKTKEHKKELLKLKKKFAFKFDDDSSKTNPAYQDRAQARRDTVGSQNHNEKTEVVSVHENISSQNKGFKMLAKMGWSEGQSLGKEGSKGLLEPIPLLSNIGTSGLGSGGTTDEPGATVGKSAIDLSKVAKYKDMVLKITQERFEKAKTADIFESESE